MAIGIDQIIQNWEQYNVIFAVVLKAVKIYKDIMNESFILPAPDSMGQHHTTARVGENSRRGRPEYKASLRVKL